MLFLENKKGGKQIRFHFQNVSVPTKQYHAGELSIVFLRKRAVNGGNNKYIQLELYLRRS